MLNYFCPGTYAQKYSTRFIFNQTRPAMNRDTFFRANTGAVILNSKGQVLAFERKDFADSWQFPQGGIDKGEPPFEAVKRELDDRVQAHWLRPLAGLFEVTVISIQRNASDVLTKID